MPLPLITRAEALAAGKKRFFPGIPCKYSHVCERYVMNGTCVECANERIRRFKEKHPGRQKELYKKWYDQNAEYSREQARKWRINNPDKKRAANAKWSRENREKERASQRKHYHANLERQRARRRKFRLENPEHEKEYAAAYRREKPHVKVAAEARRRARKRNAGGNHTADDILSLLKLQRGRCGYCKIKVGKKYHVDHIRPLFLGGSNDKINLQILCGPCNNSKHAKDPIDFARSRGFLI